MGCSYDLHTIVKEVEPLPLATIVTNTTTYGTAIDTAGYEAFEFVLSVNTWVDGAYALSLEDSDVSGSGYEAVDSELAFIKDASVSAVGLTRLGYVGHKRYVRLKIVSTGVTDGANLIGFGFLAHPKFAAVA